MGSNFYMFILSPIGSECHNLRKDNNTFSLTPLTVKLQKKIIKTLALRKSLNPDPVISGHEFHNLGKRLYGHHNHAFSLSAPAVKAEKIISKLNTN